MNRSRKKNLLVIFLVALIAATAISGEVLACPNCKEGMSGSDPVSVARATGYFYSILFMMAMPFVLVGTFGGAAYLSIRRAKDQQAQSKQALSKQSSRDDSVD
jgi:hypothetical protein